MYIPKRLIAILTALFFFFASLQSITAQDNVTLSFKDVNATDWAYSSIQWALQMNMISGYEDGTFRPNNNVTEAEFLTLLMRAFPHALTFEVQDVPDNWYSKYYLFAEALNLPVNRNNANMQINRGQVAHIIVSGLGLNYDEHESVNYLLETGLSKGKTAPTYEGYEPLSKMTRAESVTIIRNMVQKGIVNLEARPANNSDSSSNTRTNINNRFGFSIAFPATWPTEILSQNEDTVTVIGPHNGQYGEWEAYEYQFTVSASHYTEDLTNESDLWYYLDNGIYEYSKIETMILNDGNMLKMLTTGDDFPTYITGLLVKHDTVYRLEASIGSMDEQKSHMETVLAVMKTFSIPNSREDLEATLY